MKSPIVSTRISPECQKKLEELQKVYPDLTLRQMIEKYVNTLYEKTKKTPPDAT